MIELEKNMKNIESPENSIDFKIFYNTFYLKIDFNKIYNGGDHYFLGATLDERLEKIIDCFKQGILIEGFYEKKITNLY